MTGYHYTSVENWKRIRKQGLLPQRTIKHEVVEFFPHGAYVIWLWKKKLRGGEHAGSVIFQAARRGTWKVALLEVKYNPKDKLKTGDGKVVHIWHNGRLEGLVYHDRVPAVLIATPIKPEDIRLLGTYDVSKLLEEKDG